jgi:hypothetical protein
MWINRLKINGVRCFEMAEFAFSKGINLLVAPNNGGKTTVLRSIYAIQKSDEMAQNFVAPNRRAGREFGEVTMELSDLIHKYRSLMAGAVSGKVTLRGNDRHLGEPSKKQNGEAILLENAAPNNWIFPYLARRKIGQLQHTVTLPNVVAVNEISHHLYAKIDSVIGGYDGDEFKKACKDIFGVAIATRASQDGKEAGVYGGRQYFISVENLGEGTRNVLRLLVDLFTSNQGHLFLIEEPETDLHPAALKRLLEVIMDASAKHQFIISTHSNIVVKMLGGVETTKIFSLTPVPDKEIPTSTVKEVDGYDARMKLLEELGYDLFDMGLYSGYLLLEESSAERIINDLLIPEFAPTLATKLRTIACGGVTKVEKRFEEFLRLFVFLHKSPVYFQKAWVLVDGGEGTEIVTRLKENFKTWTPEHFTALNNTDFELYYPDKFKFLAHDVLKIEKKEDKRNAKKDLLEKVVSWIQTNRLEAKRAFESSAAEVIDYLKTIEKKLTK